MVSYVSGLIYLRDYSPESAEAEFEDATRTGEICDAYYRLGLINDEEEPKRAVSLFLAAAYCTVNGVKETGEIAGTAGPARFGRGFQSRPQTQPASELGEENGVSHCHPGGHDYPHPPQDSHSGDPSI